MFTTTGLFRNIPCPAREGCQALNCIFSHDETVLAAAGKDVIPKAAGSTFVGVNGHEPAVKRRRIEEASLALNSDVSRPPSSRNGTDDRNSFRPPSTTRSSNSEGKAEKVGVPKTLDKVITPPPQSKAKACNGTNEKGVPVKKETLNPRMLANSPAGHDKRTLYLKYLHEQMKRLNSAVRDSSHPEKHALNLDDQELIKASLDEEEQLAKDSSTIYANVIKQRIGWYKKLTLEGWIEHLKLRIFTSKAANVEPTTVQPLITDLTPTQELTMLDEMKTSLSDLIKMEFILEPPSDEAVADAVRMTEQASHWEVCDRCKTRFQVFPDRREEDGALTTNGPCKYHWGKLRRPKREKTDAMTGQKEAVYMCCGELMNAPGCTNADSHVYKMNESARMASVLQFVETPANLEPAKDISGRKPKAITFDCEMGYTSYGLELIRLTAVAWPDGRAVIDVLVQPKGTVLDFNSRFSGVFAETFTSAIKWTRGMAPLPESTSKGGGPLPIVPDPETARELLCSFITPDTPLIGHALENDLNSVRLCHPKIIDTVALFPHPRGLPIRYGLKALTSTHLGRDIQTGGEAGHDSLEDARATGDLVRFKVAHKWADMKKKGWKFEGQRLVGPTGKS